MIHPARALPSPYAMGEQHFSHNLHINQHVLHVRKDENYHNSAICLHHLCRRPSGKIYIINFTIVATPHLASSTTSRSLSCSRCGTLLLPHWPYHPLAFATCAYFYSGLSATDSTPIANYASLPSQTPRPHVPTVTRACRHLRKGSPRRDPCTQTTQA